MTASKQVRLPVESLPFLDDIKAALEEDAGYPISRAKVLRYAVTLAAWHLSGAVATGAPGETRPPRLGELQSQIERFKTARAEAGKEAA